MKYKCFIRWTLTTVGRRFLFSRIQRLSRTISLSLNDMNSKQSKLSTFQIFSFQKIYEWKHFLQRLLKRRINFISFLLKSEQKCNEERNEWSKKTSALSTLFPNQTHNVRKKNEMIRELLSNANKNYLLINQQSRK